MTMFLKKKNWLLFVFVLLGFFLQTVIFKIPVFAADPTPQWTPGGVAITNTNSTINNTYPPLATADGAGNTFVAWLDNRNSTNRDIYIQKFNSSGVAQWTANGVRLTNIASFIQAPNQII